MSFRDDTVVDPEFDPEDSATWPLPRGLEPRTSHVARAWLEGFEAALLMSDEFHRSGEWRVW